MEQVLAWAVIGLAVATSGATLLGVPEEPWGWAKAFGGMLILELFLLAVVGAIVALDWAIGVLA